MARLTAQMDLLIAIGRRRRQSAAYPVVIRLPDGSTLATTRLVFDPSVAGVESSEQVGELLEAALLDAPSREALGAELERTAQESGRRILLQVAPPELFGLPWELILGHGVFEPHPDLILVRHRPSLDPLAAVPPTLPVDLLLASGEDPEGQSLAEGLPHSVFRYFNVIEGAPSRPVGGPSDLGVGPADIVHLVGTHQWFELRPAGLKRSLRQLQTRLLVLQGDSASHSSALDLGHRLLDLGGPTTLVVSSRRGFPGLEPFLKGFYGEILHDQALDRSVARLARGGNVQAALLAGVGGERVLRVSPIAERLRARGHQQLAAARAAGEVLRKKVEAARAERVDVVVPDLERHGAALERAIADLTRLEIELDETQDSREMAPLTDLARRMSRAEQAVAASAAQTARVVNTWFSEGSEPLARDQSLAAGSEYWLTVQIGAPSSRSHVEGPIAIPEEELKRFYSAEGTLLRVVLFSGEFDIPEPARELRLPPPPQETEELRFAVRAPEAAVRRARLRVCVYFRQNLLQSVLVTARITAAPRRGLKPGNRGRVEFALTGSLREVDRLPARTLNILTNDAQGTHTFAVVGAQIRRQLDFDAATLESAVREARSQMQQVCSELRDGKPTRYRFEPDNRGSEAQLVSDLAVLAASGSVLYESILDHHSDFEAELAGALRQPARVQVACTHSAKYVFPWALVYEKPLVRDGNTVCGEVLEALRKGGPPGFLAGVRCFDGDCPSQGDSSVVCPSGFWGFKHVFEQPLSVANANGNGGASPELVLRIEAGGTVSLMMAVSEQLAGLPAHENELRGLPKLEFDRPRRSKLEIGTALARQDLQVVYFYCHGGRTPREPFLGVGKSDRIYPTELRGWHVRWAKCRPLVFINGCHTVDLGPTDLVSFNESFARCRAAGVIGTEISIPETLARRFARAFFARLIDGAKVGEIIQEQRMALLERYNPLGLAYTPYCSADLEVVVQ